MEEEGFNPMEALVAEYGPAHSEALFADFLTDILEPPPPLGKAEPAKPLPLHPRPCLRARG